MNTRSLLENTAPRPAAGALPRTGVGLKLTPGLILSACLIAFCSIAGTSIAQAQCATVPSGMVAWWPGDGNTFDIGGPHTGTSLKGSATYGAGMVGQAFSFNSTGSIVNSVPTDDLDIRSAITIAAWVKPLVSMASSQLIAGRPFAYHMSVSNDGHVNFAFANSAVYRGVQSTSAIPTTGFTFVAGQYDSSTGSMSVYINGVLERTVQTTGLIDAVTKPFQIGGFADPALSAAPFTGLIDEVQLFNRALTPSEIQSIYSSGGAGMCKTSTPGQPTITDYSLPKAPSGYDTTPYDITAGPDGNLWFTTAASYQGGGLGKMTTAGVLTRYWTDPYAENRSITVGADGALWYTQSGYARIGRMTTEGSLSQFAADGQGWGITTGADGEVWSTNGWNIDRMTPSGSWRGFATGSPGYVRSLTAGPDGNVWYTWPDGSKVVRITHDGVKTEFSTIATGAITTGPDGNLWVTGGEGIIKMAPTGSWTVIRPKPGWISAMNAITAGPDGNVWMPAGHYYQGDGLLKVTPAGTYTFYALPNSQTSTYTNGNPTTYPNANPLGQGLGIATGCDGNLWFTESNASKIGKFTFPGPRVLSVSSPNPDGVYGPGSQILLALTFNAPVIVTGTPRLSLNSGGTAVYASGSGTATLIFTYSVLAGENSSELDARWFSTQDAANIRDSSNNGALLRVPSSWCGSLGASKAIAISPISLDSTPPVTTASRFPAPNGGGWNNNEVSVALSAIDNSGGSGVKQITYSAAGAQSIASTTVSGATASISMTVEGTTTLTYYATDNAGNVEAAQNVVIKIDNTAPAISGPAVTGTLGNNGWYTSDVTVSWTVDDPQSGIASSTGCASTLVSADTAGVTITCAATNGSGLTSSVPVTIKIDKTPPVANAIAAPAANTAGWNNTDVTVAFTGTDPTSGVASCTVAKVLNSEGAGQSASGSCTDNAGNVGTTAAVTAINIDKTPPTATASALPVSNSAGWNNSDVTVTFTGSDALSGIANCTLPKTLSTEGAGQSAAGSCTDKAGNVSAESMAGSIKIDKTAPVVSATRTPAANAAGWNNSDVVVAFTCTDPLSGMPDVSIPAPVTLSAEGQNQSVSRSCTDRAGNTTPFTMGGINIDKTPPAASASAAPPPNANGWNNGDVTISFTGTDSLSGGVTCTGPVTLAAEASGQSASGSCMDQAGNSAAVTKPGINIDKTKPAITFAGRTAPNSAGWNNANVILNWNCSDSLSGPPASNVSQTLTIEGAAQSSTGSCTDLAGNSVSNTQNGINIDKTPPSVTLGAATPPANANGWNNTNVSIPFTVSDLVSGPAPDNPTSPLLFSDEGASLGRTLTFKDMAGNSTAILSPRVSIDKTAPVTTATPAPLPNVNGWNNTDVSVAFAAADTLSGVASCSPPLSLNADGANQPASGICTDRAGNSAPALASVNIDKRLPLTANLNITPNPVSVNTAVSASADLSDTGSSNLSSADYSINGASPAVLSAATGTSARVTGSLSPFAATGVYSVCVHARDRAGNVGADDCLFLPVYDPNGGFVTGGGWIQSPVGAYTADPSLTGKATFGFVSRYQHGANVPTGDTQFQFQVANLKFKSTVYQWLVIAGARAQYKGSGTINGTGEYTFLLTAIDGEMPGGGGVDRFRIKIWSAGGIVYDSQAAADDNSDPSTGLGGGSIVIHK